jgi:hypothetical protein
MRPAHTIRSIMTIDLEEMRQKKAFEEAEANKLSEAQPVTTAFLVVQDENGQWTALAEYEDKDFELSRRATFDDMVGGCANITMGCQVQQSAVATMIMMEQRAQQMQMFARQQAETQAVASLIDPKKLRA